MDQHKEFTVIIILMIENWINLKFVYWDLGFISDLEIRISYLK